MVAVGRMHGKGAERDCHVAAPDRARPRSVSMQALRITHLYERILFFSVSHTSHDH